VLAAAGQSVEKHRWSHLPHLLKRFSEERPAVMKVEVDDVTLEPSTHMVTVSNSPLLGNNLLAAPGAKMDDGMLDVRVYDGLGEADLAKLFASGSGGHPIEMKSYRAKRVRIRSEEPVEVNSDMVIVRPRRVIEIEVLPGAVSMIVGNGIALSVPVESAPQATTLGPAPPPNPNGSAEAVVEDANAGR
jgi:diacylglycerol kinase family enzyme